MMPKWLTDANDGCDFNGLGRVIAVRRFGGIVFLLARFSGATVQLFAERKIMVCFSEIDNVAFGDWIEFVGYKSISRRGEPSIALKRVKIVSRSAYTFADKFHGLSQGLRYKERLLDLLSSEATFEFFDLISAITQQIRKFLWGHEFKEFNTGVLQSFFEAGAAVPFETICNATGKSQYLSLTSEIKIKRLLAAGFYKVFEISQSFRNEGIDSMHSPEFTLLEVYQLGADYNVMMKLVENMIAEVSKLSPTISETVDFDIPFQRVSFYKAVEEIIGLSRSECNLAMLTERFPDAFTFGMSRFTWVFKLINQFISPFFEKPTFVTEIPSTISPFVKTSVSDSGLSERAALVVDGIDIADIYTDENNPVTVEALMRDQEAITGRELNQSYLEMLRYGLPQSAGIGMGLNRLFLLFRGDLPLNIKETILYPIQ